MEASASAEGGGGSAATRSSPAAVHATNDDAAASEDLAIQTTILDSAWFKASKRLCAYISYQQLREVDTSKILEGCLSSNPGQEELAKDLYVPRVEDKNSNMWMLKITTMDDLVKNSMNILEPSPVDATGNDREDVLSSSSPVDLLLLPGMSSIIYFINAPSHELG
ncbi:5-formyltetrahydrofolate cyclo-ligase, mitochondrial-like [Miscanthus floridulus]